MKAFESAFWRKHLPGLLAASLFFTSSVLAAGSAAGEKASAEALAEPSGKAEWSEDFAQAFAESQESGQPMLLLFTGSDWCPPCIQLERAVFSSAEFAGFAEAHLVLMKADFPRGPQDEAIARQNQELQRQFPVRGYPTVLLIDTQEGNVLHAQGGYGGQTATEYVAELKAAMEQRT